MTPARWGRIKEVFAGARELGESGRAAYLEAACASDAGLRVEVEKLLAEDSVSSRYRGRNEDFVPVL